MTDPINTGSLAAMPAPKLRCPHCGSTDVGIINDHRFKVSPRRWRLKIPYCSNCGAQGPAYDVAGGKDLFDEAII